MCAWCYLADTMLSSLKDKYDFEVEHIGFELHEGTPENGEDMNINHPGTPQTIAYINQIGAPFGLHLCELPILANAKKALRYYEGYMGAAPCDPLQLCGSHLYP